MLKLKEILLVEGKYDAARLHNLVGFEAWGDSGNM